MELLLILFGLLSGSLLSVLVGMIGSRRRIGFGIPFLLSLVFTPLAGLVVALLSDPLPDGTARLGCIGTLVAVLGFACLAVFLLLLLGVGVVAAAA